MQQLLFLILATAIHAFSPKPNMLGQCKKECEGKYGDGGKGPYHRRMQQVAATFHHDDEKPGYGHDGDDKDDDDHDYGHGGGDNQLGECKKECEEKYGDGSKPEYGEHHDDDDHDYGKSGGGEHRNDDDHDYGKSGGGDHGDEPGYNGGDEPGYHGDGDHKYRRKARN